MTTDNVLGLVLSGGQSRRMGRDKALLRTNGESQLGRAVRLLEQHVARVFVSARAEQANEPERARFSQIVDRYADLGPLAGILSAMDTQPEAAWLVVACDLPNLDSESIRYLLAERSLMHPFTAYRSTFDGLPEPLCAVYSATSRAIIDEFVSVGVHCPRKIMLRSDTRLLDARNPRALDNINTPDELSQHAARRVS
ncbi:MAG TPA: NTP transferase domain-containing protein [Woeseiaceae bacterium]